jgi:hypothetical protein
MHKRNYLETELKRKAKIVRCRIVIFRTVICIIYCQPTQWQHQRSEAWGLEARTLNRGFESRLGCWCLSFIFLCYVALCRRVQALWRADHSLKESYRTSKIDHETKTKNAGQGPHRAVQPAINERIYRKLVVASRSAAVRRCASPGCNRLRKQLRSSGAHSLLSACIYQPAQATCICDLLPLLCLS